MADYGVTENGFMIKRLDQIKNDITEKLREGWGYDTTIHPQSFLNVLVTGFSDEIAKLWEVAQEEYYSMYPSSAEGSNLDNVMQYAGITREKDTRTTYMLACTAPDDTVIDYGVLVKSKTNPEKMFRCTNTQTISRESFRKAVLRLYMESGNLLFYININNQNFQYAAQESETEEDILNALYKLIDLPNIHCSVDKEKRILILEDIYKQTSNTLAISTNILVESCTSNILFESMEYGPLIIADGLINEMVSGNTGILEIKNDIAPVLGRFMADDVEARQDYIKRCATRSKNMIESITAEIYNSVEHVEAVAGYENDTEVMDREGRPPKCVEIVVDGGDDGEIANIIYQKKTNGIRAYGTITMDVADSFGNIHKVGFSRPDYRYVWLHVTLTMKSGAQYAPNFAALTKEAILNNAKVIQVGDNVYLQTFIADIYKKVTGVSLVDIRAFLTASSSQVPEEYPLTNILVNARQKAVFSESRIEVLLT